MLESEEVENIERGTSKKKSKRETKCMRRGRKIDLESGGMCS